MKGKARRLLSWVCVLALCMSLLPVTALAIGTNGYAENTYNDKESAQEATGVTANKTVRPNEDGTYTVTLSVEGYTQDSSTTQDLPADIVLVVDTSTSMADEVGWKVCGCTEFTEETVWFGTMYVCKECDTAYNNYQPDSCTNRISINRLDVAKDAAKTFVNGLLDSSNDVRIGLYDFSGSNRTNVALTDGQQTLIAAIEDLYMPSWGNGTDYGLGLRGASNILAESSNDRQKFVVFLSDGEPSDGENGGREAADLKQDGVTIFTVGIDIGSEYGNAAQALKNISSEDKEGNKYFYEASSDGDSGNALSDILEQIKETIPSLINAGKNAVMTDVINTESFELVDPVEGLDHKNGTLTWNIGDITGTKETVSFTIKPKEGNTATGAVHTNSDVTLSFDSTKTGTKVTFNEGAIGDPTVDLYSVTYTDGVAEEVFFDQITYNLRPGSATPAFDGTPKREGYTFVGWSDGKNTYEAGQELPRVSGDVTYTAQWKNNMTPTAHDITIEVVLDGNTSSPISDGNVDTYIGVNPYQNASESGDENWNPGRYNEGKVTYDITYYDCKDIGFAAKDGYVIEAIDADLVYGQSGCQGIYEINSSDLTQYGDYMADNVKGGSTVTVYVRTLYSVEYYLDGEKQTEATYNDTTKYVTGTTVFEDDIPSVPKPSNGQGTGGYYHVDCNCEEEGKECKHTGYTDVNGAQTPSDARLVIQQDSTITLPSLPTKANYTVDGWWLDQSCTDKPDFEVGSEVLVSEVKPDNGTVIKFYSESTPVTAGYTVKYVFLNENREEIAGTDSWTSGNNFPKSGTAAIGEKVTVIPPSIATGNNNDHYILISEGHSCNITGDPSKNVITVTYALDNWGDKDDSETGGDGTPDYRQALIKYVVADGQENYGSVTPGTQVETLTESEGTYTGSVTASSKATAEVGYAFDYWTKDSTDWKGWDSELSDTFTAQGGKTYTYTANFAEDTNKDDIPDKYQAFVNFVSADDKQGTVSGDGTTQVFTLTDDNDNYVESGTITPVNTEITITPANGYAFDIWTEGEDDSAVNPFTAIEVNGGDTITFYANFDTDEIGTKDPDKGDGIPDKYEATVTYKVVGGTWRDDSAADIQKVFDLKTYDEATGQWNPADPTPTLGDSIPNGMKPGTGYVEPGNWDATISKDTLVTGNVTYTYTFPEASPGLTVVKEADETYVNVGEDIHYTVTVENTGDVALEDVKVIDILWKDGDVISVQVGESDPQNYEVADGSVTIPEIPVTTSAEITYTYTTTKTGEISNTVTVESPTLPDGPTSTTEKVSVYDPSVAIQKELTSVSRGESTITDDALQEFTAQVGDKLTYQITVTNDGVGPLGKVDVTDSLWGHGVNAVYIGNREDGTPVTDGGTVTITELGETESETITYTYTVQASDIGKQNISNTAIASTGTEEDDPKDDDTVNVPMDNYTVTITPADITIYTGGDGYSGVTDGDGNVIPGTETSGLPEPGYFITLPASVRSWLESKDVGSTGQDLSGKLKFTYNVPGSDSEQVTREWILTYVGVHDNDSNVYSMAPTTNTPAVRLAFKDPVTGEAIKSDKILEMSENSVCGTYNMTIDPGELDQSEVKAVLTVDDDSITCQTKVDTGKLTIRSVVNQENNTNSIATDSSTVDADTITAVADENVNYYVNDSEVEVKNEGDRVQLLVDEVSNGEEFNAAMGADAIERVTNAAGNTLSNAAYDLAYMDLVDTQNGNTVVTMGEDQSLTIYWPVPDDAAEDSEFHVVHYTEMDRQNTTSESELESAKTIMPDTNTTTINGQKYVTFTTESFSPFALVYEKAPDPVASLDVTKTLTAVNGKTPGSSVSVGDTLTYTITVKNGEVALNNVTITDTFTGKGDLVFNGYTATENPAGTYTIELGNLEANETVTITATYKVLRADASSDLTNAVKVNGTNPGGGGDPTPGEDTETTPVNPYHPPIRPPEDPDKPELNTEDHYAYIVGYEDGSVQPEGDITRAEVATIFFRLLTDESRNEYWSQTNPYSDVSADDWFNNAVSTLTNAGVLDGYEDGTFKPNGNITRAEFATITARFFEATYDGENLFPDIEGHWAQDYINEAANAGIVNGYEDGTFRPQQYITRAEAVTMVNRTIERHPDADHLLDDMIVWPDNPETAWYYEQIQEATNSHEYTMNTDDEQNPYEIWTNLLPNRDWSELEKEWSDANDGAGSGEVV